MSNQVSESDRLRLPRQVYAPDSRQGRFVRVDRKTGACRERMVEDQYEAVSCYILNTCVPKDIATHFETARNLYLYAWFVYRFYSVAEQQVLATLEFALRERFPDFVTAEKNKHSRKFEPGLKKLMKYAIESGFIRNEYFSARERWAKMRAKSRCSSQKRHEALNAGLDRWEEDDSEIVVTQEDLDYDWLGEFLEIIPRVRNLYAHGTFHLYPAKVSHTFEMVSELINQLYPNKV